MLWVIFLINDKEPLMFINTTTSVNNSSWQEKYDSRFKPKTVVEEVISTLSDKEIKKIKSMVELYNRNQMVYCKLVLKDKEILGVPVMLKNNILTLKNSDSVLNDVNISTIKSIEIVHF